VTPSYDIIVIGAGHAGCEAALASARMGCRVLLLTIELDTIAKMPCSPSIGGVAKGQIVKDIDALGGEMAKVTDQTAIQYRTLNTSKGAAVQSTRTQNDKWRYQAAMKHVLEAQANLHIRQALVEDILTEDGRVVGVRDWTGQTYAAGAIVLATGTFLSGLMHIGTASMRAGRAGEFAAYGLAQGLRRLGFRLGRMKTGTPARLRRSTIDFSRFTVQHGDEHPRPFSLFTKSIPLPQVPCFQGNTNPRVHDIVRRNLERSALYGGQITGTPARYCPSFEDKVVRFGDKDQHPVMLEPEGLDSEEIYASGLGNSMPIDVQQELIHAVEGLEQAEIMRPAYAIEYEYIDPIQLTGTLETKLVAGLYHAGQINGTSGYEEAAGQGLWAGINAALSVQKRPPFLPDRSQSYLSVMVDDLVTQGTDEPYRMFTSRAEYRLLLREDNADERLMQMGHDLGLIGADALADMRERRRQIAAEVGRLKSTLLPVSEAANALLTSRGASVLKAAAPLDQLLKRPELQYADVAALEGRTLDEHAAEVGRHAEIQVKYEGHVERSMREVEEFRKLEGFRIPPAIVYEDVYGLSTELKQKLATVRPDCMGRASRIPGMTPAAITAIMLHIKRREKD
jgi:tRNA uridine 5-carboxymethylaminomethyl modification enzyme